MTALSSIVESFVNRKEHACAQCAGSHMQVTKDAEHNVMVLQVNRKPAIFWHLRDGGRINVQLGQRFEQSEIDDIRSFMEVLPHAYPIERRDTGLHLDPNLIDRGAANDSESKTPESTDKDGRLSLLSRFLKTLNKAVRS